MDVSALTLLVVDDVFRNLPLGATPSFPITAGIMKWRE
jgi:hypothetical protein